jgi:hypothetical protein
MVEKKPAPPSPIYKIVKVGGTEPAPVPPSKPAELKPEVKPTLKTGGKKKSMKTFPRGVLKKTLKVRAVSDPAKPPPFKKLSRKHTIRLFTDKGESRRRKTIKKKVSKMSDAKVDEMVQKHNLLKSSETPPRIKREMLSGAMMAGFISLD